MCMYFDFLRSCVFFFFKQKTAYEMRISDWSSDVCSSDLLALSIGQGHASGDPREAGPDGSFGAPKKERHCNTGRFWSFGLSPGRIARSWHDGVVGRGFRQDRGRFSFRYRFYGCADQGVEKEHPRSTEFNIKTDGTCPRSYRWAWE